jgi:hypothetical protein
MNISEQQAAIANQVALNNFNELQQSPKEPDHLRMYRLYHQETIFSRILARFSKRIWQGTILFAVLIGLKIIWSFPLDIVGNVMLLYWTVCFMWIYTSTSYERHKHMKSMTELWNKLFPEDQV